MTPRRAFFLIHLYAGLTVGAVLAVTGASGAALVFAESLEARLHPQRRPAAARPGEAPAPLGAVLAAVQAHEGGASPRLLRLAAHPGAAHVAWMDGHGERLVYVDPVRAQVLDVREAHADLLGTLRALHVRLLGGERGEAVVGAFGLVLLALSLSGLVLWWPGRRSVRKALTVRRPLRWRRGNYDVHRLAGALALLPLLVAGLTGSSLAFGPALTRGLVAVGLLPPPAALPPLTPRPVLALDILFARAQAALPGAQATRVDLPQTPGAPLRVRMRFPEELHPNGMSGVTLDAGTGAVLRADDARKAPLAARLLALRYPLHIGAWGGLPTRLLALLTGLTPALLFFTGFFHWLARLRAESRVVSAVPSPRPTP